MVVKLTAYARHNIATHIVQQLAAAVGVNNGKALIGPSVSQKLCSINHLHAHSTSCLQHRSSKRAHARVQQPARHM